MIRTKQQIDYLAEWLIENRHLFNWDEVLKRIDVTKESLINICYMLYSQIINEDVNKIIDFLNSISFSFPERIMNSDAIICEEVSKQFYKRITPDDIKGESRKREIIYAKHLCMTYRNKVMGFTLKDSALPYCRDHATVLNARKSIRNLLETDKSFLGMVERIEQRTGQEIIKKILK